MMLSDLQNKDVINITDGKKVGSIIDINLDNEGKVIEISLQKRRFLKKKSGEIFIMRRKI